MKNFENQKYQNWSFLAENQNLLHILIYQPISKFSRDLRPMRHMLSLLKIREKLSNLTHPSMYLAWLVQLIKCATVGDILCGKRSRI